MNARVYTLGDLRRVIKESSDEFKPKLGLNVEKDNKKINNDAYKQISKETKVYDGNVKNNDKNESIGDAPTAATNKGMQDLEYQGMNNEFKDRVKSQLKGYTSVEDEKNHKGDVFGNAVFGNDKQYKKMADKAKKDKEMKDLGKEIGLTSREIEKGKFKELNNTMFESNNMKKLVFKHTTFLSENHVATRIPDEYKTNGSKFLVKDKSDNEYLVEWADDKANITKRISNEQINEEKNRIKELYNYKSKEYFNGTTTKTRLDEDNKFSDMLNKARKLMN